jgi:diguanylate cyclase (GGDEF)-like protein/PAS domain S-box-containing protein
VQTGAEEDPSRAHGAVSRRRLITTVLVMALVLAAEFAGMIRVYDRGSPTRAQRVVLSSLAGEVQVARGAQLPTLSADSALTVHHLSQLGLGGTRLADVATAGQLLGAHPDSPRALSRLRIAVTRLRDQLAARQHDYDRQAIALFGVLLVVSAVGWGTWFRRSVRRHRRIEHRWTVRRARHEGEQRLAAMVRNAADTFAVSDENGVVTFISPSVRPLLGVDASEVIYRHWSQWVLPEDVDAVRRALSVPPGRDGPIATRLRRRDGRVIHVEGNVTNLLDDPMIGGMLITIRDVTTRVELERELGYQAQHDALTGLPNRKLLGELLAETLEQPTEPPRQLVVLFCDLDDFKNVNDSFGHEVGDHVLRAVGQRALRVVRPGDTVARLGGDEFAVLVADADLAVAHRVATRLLEAISAPMSINGQTVSVRASIGLAHATAGKMTGTEALRNADVAMYLAKDRGKARLAVYESGLHAEVLDQIELHADLQRAIAENELVLHFQPVIDLAADAAIATESAAPGGISGAVIGFEALVRWAHPTRGLLYPETFIPLAEQTGLVRPLGAWVLETACEAALTLGARAPAGQRPPRISVNVAAQQLAHPDFVGEVLQVLTTTGLAPDRLTLEITESVLLHDLTTVVERLAVLRQVGIRIAIDDFGTGYSSLAYLRKLPLDVLKVDKAFVDRVTVDAHDAALTEAILAMSSAMNLTTVAEGVEHADQAAWLARAKCGFAQGYLWSRPVPLDTALTLVAGVEPSDDADATVLEMVRPAARRLAPATPPLRHTSLP